VENQQEQRGEEKKTWGSKREEGEKGAFGESQVFAHKGTEKNSARGSEQKYHSNGNVTKEISEKGGVIQGDKTKKKKKTMLPKV